MKTFAFSSFCCYETTCVAFIRSIKHYFLMDKGDFFVHFMDLTEEELKKPVDDIVPPRLEALLELALRMSTANTDPFKDDLKVGSDTEPLQVEVIICQLNHSERNELEDLIYMQFTVVISYRQHLSSAEGVLVTHLNHKIRCEL